MNLRSLLLAACAVTVSACATRGTVVRSIAASELGCPESSIKVKHVEGRIFRATGCGDSIEVACTDPYESTGAAKGVFDGATSGNRVHCERLGSRATTTAATTARAPATTPPVATAPPPAGRPGELDRALAARLFDAAAGRARSCGRRGGPTGEGRARVFVGTDGLVSRVELAPPFADTEVGRCVTTELSRVSLPPFTGEPVVLAKTFEVPAPTGTDL